ncbi:KilA-N domain-containing protein [Daejeonella oryzae]|uniref:KilA-N domain-containing protein n=1 Tax=Daejeonella oryzae TaxID=1122943 RepID=UPI000403D1C0|nr:KilA-N domain-containing protein [Daejeonella oryzae]
MDIQKNSVINYQGSQISIFSDDRDDYINITEMAIASRGRKSIRSWMRNTATVGYLSAWERKNNINFLGAQMDAKQLITDRDEISIKNWIEKTNAVGIFTRSGTHAGTYAHKDIAIKFAGWLNPEFELFLIEKVQELRTLEDKKNSFDLLTHEQILYLIRIKEVFKFVAHQKMIEDAHKEVFGARSGSKNPFSDFHRWRNEILDIAPQTIDDRIKQYCIENHIAITKKILHKSKQEKILKLDSYMSVRNAVWDLLEIKGELNALNLANLS